MNETILQDTFNSLLPINGCKCKDILKSIDSNYKENRYFKKKDRVIDFELYKQVNSFFNTFCSLTGYDLIILAHPTRNIQTMQKFFPDYKIIQNKKNVQLITSKLEFKYLKSFMNIWMYEYNMISNLKRYVFF